MVSYPVFQIVFALIVVSVFLNHEGRCCAQDDHDELHEIDIRIGEAIRERRKFARLETLSKRKIELLRELKRLHGVIESSEAAREANASDEQGVEDAERNVEVLEVGIETTNLHLEFLERRFGLEELATEWSPGQRELAEEADSLIRRLDVADKLVTRLSAARVADNGNDVQALEREMEEIESDFELRREILHLRFELKHAREEGDEAWLREIESELEDLLAEQEHDRHIEKELVSRLPAVVRLTDDEIEAAGRADFDTEILPRLRSACFDCHSSSNVSGDLDLEQLLTVKPFVVNRRQWLNVIEQLKVRSMPPADAEQPSKQDHHAMLGWLIDAIENFDYATVRQVGSGPTRRLTHDEYNHTVRDLVGRDLRPADHFPPDLTASSGFDNSANSLFIQPITLERYVGAAEMIVREAWPTESGSQEYETARQRLLGEVRTLDSQQSVQQVVRRFASRSYRRPVEEDELKSLMRHFDQRRSRAASSETALREVLQVILISPNFLLRTESISAGLARDVSGKARPVSDWELASRLSYFLWASMPDDELFEEARAGRLHDVKVLQRQVDRMLKDKKAETLGSLFAAQWLGFGGLDRVQRDQIENPWATDSLVDAMKRESAMLFNSLVRENASLDRLLDADYTFINGELAKHYGIKGVTGDHMRRVSLQETPRRGVLGHASILATTSFPRRTSPVMRGNWILSTLLGTPPPPPPPNASEFAERVAENERISQRRKLELHRSKPNCYSCHSLIDPLGFALEEFEWFGRYRPQRRGKAVDAVGQLPDGTRFHGLSGLSATLLDARRDELAEQLTRKMLSYSLGRQLEYYDEATVIELKQQLLDDECRIATLIRSIVQSDTFRMTQR